MAEDDKVQGEGDYESARKYKKDTEEFVESGKVDEAAREAGEVSDKERAEMEKAEKEGESHIHEKDPNVPRDYDEPS